MMEWIVSILVFVVAGSLVAFGRRIERNKIAADSAKRLGDTVIVYDRTEKRIDEIRNRDLSESDIGQLLSTYHDEPKH